MKQPTFDRRLTAAAIFIIGLTLSLIPFHAFMTVWLASLAGHYTLLRLWPEILLAILVVVAGYIVWLDVNLRRRLLTSRLVQLILGYSALQIALGLIAFGRHQVSRTALGYGWIVDLRFLLFFLVVFIIASHAKQLANRWQKLLLIPAAVVVVFGLLQYLVLPYDFLRHFGYNQSTIYPYEDINHNSHYIRIMSTLRGANPLGAYLVVVISGLAVLYLKAKGLRRWLWLAAGVATGVALVFSFSRSAWIGTGLSAIVIILASIKGRQIRRVSLGLTIGGLIVIGGLFLALRHNLTLQNALLHTSSQSTVAVSSNQAHESALKSGLHDVLHEPLGRGPGSAGPASVYNNHPARIAENYFVQIGQEVGWLGLALFIVIYGLVGGNLWLNRRQPLALALLASLVGLTFVNLLSHAWADETLSYLWWGLAGLLFAQAEQKTKFI